MQSGPSIDAAIAAAARDAIIGAIAVGALPFPGFGTRHFRLRLFRWWMQRIRRQLPAFLMRGKEQWNHPRAGRSSRDRRASKHRPCHYARTVYSGHSSPATGSRHPILFQRIHRLLPTACRHCFRVGAGNSVRPAAEYTVRSGWSAEADRTGDTPAITTKSSRSAEQHNPNCGTKFDRPLLVRSFSCRLEPDRSCCC